MTVLWVVVALVAITGAVVVRRRPGMPRRRLLLSLLWTAALVAVLLALQGFVMFTAAGTALLWGLALLARGGLREPGGRFTGRGVAVLLLLVSGVLLLVFAVGAATDSRSGQRYTPVSRPTPAAADDPNLAGRASAVPSSLETA